MGLCRAVKCGIKGRSPPCRATSVAGGASSPADLNDGFDEEGFCGTALVLVSQLGYCPQRGDSAPSMKWEWLRRTKPVRYHYGPVGRRARWTITLGLLFVVMRARRVSPTIWCHKSGLTPKLSPNAFHGITTSSSQLVNTLVSYLTNSYHNNWLCEFTGFGCEGLINYVNLKCNGWIPLLRGRWTNILAVPPIVFDPCRGPSTKIPVLVRGFITNHSNSNYVLYLSTSKTPHGTTYCNSLWTMKPSEESSRVHQPLHADSNQINVLAWRLDNQVLAKLKLVGSEAITLHNTTTSNRTHLT